jgi:hypothetical protein
VSEECEENSRDEEEREGVSGGEEKQALVKVEHIVEVDVMTPNDKSGALSVGGISGMVRERSVA